MRIKLGRTKPEVEFTEWDHARFMSYILPDPATGCLTWTGGKLKSGYGTFVIGRKKDGTQHRVLAHRLAWVLAGNRLDDDQFVCHSCDRPSCVSAKRHLFVGTAQQNSSDMASKKRGRKGLLPQGVSRTKFGRFLARTAFSNEAIHLGTFATADEAAEIVEIARHALFYEGYRVSPPPRKDGRKPGPKKYRAQIWAFGTSHLFGMHNSLEAAEKAKKRALDFVAKHGRVPTKAEVLGLPGSATDGWYCLIQGGVLHRVEQGRSLCGYLPGVDRDAPTFPHSKTCTHCERHLTDRQHLPQHLY